MVEELGVAQQRQILEAKREQVRAQAFEHALNAELMEAQLPLEMDHGEKRKLEQKIRESRKSSRLLTAAAAVCTKRLDALPVEKVEDAGEEEEVVEAVLPSMD